MKSALLAFCLAALPVMAGDPPKSDLYVVSVGVEARLSRLGRNDMYANDAGTMAGAFGAAKPLYKEVHTTVVNGMAANREAVLKTLRETARVMKKEDVAVVFFSAHAGYNSAKKFSITLARQTDKKLDDEALDGDDLRRALATMKGRVLLMLDTCNAAGILPGGNQATGNVSFFLACGAQESSSGSGPGTKNPHGCFVAAAVEGLGGLADSNSDGTVTAGEFAAWVTSRSRELNAAQNAVFKAQPELGAVPLAAVDKAVKRGKRAKPAASARNPFGLPDVVKPMGPDVMAFVRSIRIPNNNSEDPNAAQWAVAPVKATSDSVDGDWEARWKPEGSSEWESGRARISTVGESTFILFHSRSGKYLIECRRNGPKVLAGRYVNVNDTNDTSPWKGKIIADDRIDGYYAGGRWDFRRRIN